MYNFQLAEITEINEYLERLRNPYYSVIITFDRLSDEECRNIASLKNINLKNSSQLLLIYENGKTTFLNADAEEKKVFIQDINSRRYLNLSRIDSNNNMGYLFMTIE